MNQIRLYITTSKEVAEDYYNMLENAVEEQAWPLAVSEQTKDSSLYELSLYVDKDIKAEAIALMVELLPIEEGQIACEVLPDIDWVQHSLAGLKPVRAGRFFVHGSHDRDKITKDDLAIEIEAGQAFGTGHHGTTAGCLQMIEKIIAPEHPQNALDLGTGSGVLAIGMAKLGLKNILATDIDPVAVDVAQGNIELNHVADQIETLTSTGFDHPIMQERAPFDLIVANILARPLVELAPEIKANLAQGGAIILSGILTTQHDMVVAAFQAQGFKHCETLELEGWVTILMK